MHRHCPHQVAEPRPLRLGKRAVEESHELAGFLVARMPCENLAKVAPSRGGVALCDREKAEAHAGLWRIRLDGTQGLEFCLGFGILRRLPKLDGSLELVARGQT